MRAVAGTGLACFWFGAGCGQQPVQQLPDPFGELALHCDRKRKQGRLWGGVTLPACSCLAKEMPVY